VADDGIERLGLEVDPEPVRFESQDPHVGLHVALAIQQCGVAARARGARLDVVGELALEELERVVAGHQQLAPLGALDNARALAERAVLAVELDEGIGGHGAILGRPRRVPPIFRLR
jgi:hypothetical protein